MTAYYNEFDPKAAAWLRELIGAGLIAPGEVDERSILEVQPDDLCGFTQCHFFAGIGGWSYALRLAGWGDHVPVWTGSPPCQPFSVSGKGLGPDDERHLAPHFIKLVGACRPRVLFGEQVASAAVLGKASRSAKRSAGTSPEWAWFDDLSDRLEAARYSVGAADIPAAGIGAPNIRQRTFFGAIDLGFASGGLPDTASCGWLGWSGHDTQGSWGGRPRSGDTGSSHGLANKQSRGRGIVGDALVKGEGGHADCGCDTSGRLDNTSGDGRQEGRQRDNRTDDGAISDAARADCGLVNADNARLQRHRGFERVDDQGRWEGEGRHGAPSGVHGGVDDTSSGHASSEREQCSGEYGLQPVSGGGAAGFDNAGEAQDFWSDADWLLCRDGKWRPVEPRTFPLAHGVSGRVGLLRGYGNAINPWAAKVFVEAFSGAIL